MEGSTLFEWADRLKALRDRKEALEAELKQVNVDIDDADWHLSNLMAESETQNFTRAGTMDATQRETNALIGEVLSALVSYLEENYLHKRIGTDEASEFLFHFFDTYGMTVVHDSSLLRAVTTANGTYNFYVARFVLENYENRTSVFDKLLRITSGFLIHKAVYFYTSEIKASFDSKLKNVSFYLDC